MPVGSIVGSAGGGNTSSESIDALDLINFQEAMLANQAQDEDADLPVIDGVAFGGETARTTDPLTPITAMTNNISTLLTMDNTTPEGTHLIASVILNVNDWSSGIVMTGFIIQEAELASPLVYDIAAHGDNLIIHNNTDSLIINTIVTIEMYVHNSTLIVKYTSPSFFAATNSAYNGSKHYSYPLSSIPTRVHSYSGIASALPGSAASINFTSMSVIQL